ncbi:MAG: hypothetical protein ACPG52_11800 [Cognaticolwellia sp.]
MSEDKLFFDDNIYLLEANASKEFLQMNQYRIAKGDAISAQSLNRAKASFGR